MARPERTGTMASKGAVSGAASAEQAVQASSERAVKGPPVILASKAATVAAVVAGAERSASKAATAALAATAACRARVLAGVLPAPGSYRALRRTLPNQGQTEGHRMASTSEAHRPRTSRSRVRISPVESAGTLATPPSQACLVSPPRATIS